MNTRQKSGGPLPVCNFNNEVKIDSYGDYMTNTDFVAIVKLHECIYNPKAPNFSKKEEVDKVWEAIAARCSDTVKACKRRWKSIRSGYIKGLKEGNKPYFLAHLCEFLRPHVTTCCVKPYCVHKIGQRNSDIAPKPSGDKTVALIDSNEAPRLQHEDVSIAGTNIQDKVPWDGGAIRVINDENLEKEQDSVKNETEQAAVDIEKHQNENNAKDGEPSFSLSNKRKSEPVHNNNETKQPKIINSTETTLNGSSIHVMFFQSFLPFIDEMTSKENRRFKREVMNLIDDILDEKNDPA